MPRKEEYERLVVKGVGKSRESKVILGAVDTDDFRHLFFVPIQPNGEYQEMAIGIKLTELKSRINQIENLNIEIVLNGITETREIKEKIIIRPAENDNLELTFTKPGTHERDAEILLKIRPKQRRPGKKFPYHEINILVRKRDLVGAIKVFIKNHCK
ncbi:MAG: hypothetical protein Q8Q06_00200 [bacterium]|nr:hypothetical protein [bacterium]